MRKGKLLVGAVLVALALSLAQRPATAAKGENEAPRKAVIHLKEGRYLTVTLHGMRDGAFMVEHDGQRTRIDASRITNIRFKEPRPPEPERRTRGEIVFEARRNEQWDLWMMKPDGSDLKNLTGTTSRDERAPAFYPDGDGGSFRQGGRLRMLDLGTDKMVRWVTVGGEDSPKTLKGRHEWLDRTHVLYLVGPSEPRKGQVRHRLHVFGLRSQKQNLVLDPGIAGGNAIRGFDLSPDGNTLAFCAGKAGSPATFDLYMTEMPALDSLPLKEADIRRLSGDEEAFKDVYPAWIHPEREVAWGRYDSQAEEATVLAVEPSSGRQRRLARRKGASTIQPHAWMSYPEKLLVNLRSPEGRRDLYAVDPGDQSMQNLTNTPDLSEGSADYAPYSIYFKPGDRRPAPPVLRTDGAEFSFHTSGGKTVGSGTVRTLSAPYRPLQDPTIVESFRVDLDRIQGDEVLFLVRYKGAFPYQLYAATTTGDLLGRYWHPGPIHVVEFYDVDGDGTEEIVAGGANHDVRPGNLNVPVVFCLDAEKMEGEAPPRKGAIGSGTEKWYTILEQDLDAGIASISKENGKFLCGTDQPGEDRYYYEVDCRSGAVMRRRLKKLKLDLPEPLFSGTVPHLGDQPHLTTERGREHPNYILAPEGTENVALDKPVTASCEPVLGKLSQVTDGDRSGRGGTAVTLRPGKQWVQIDLGKPHPIYKVLLWHYFRKTRIYRDVVVQVSNDPEFQKNVKTIFNNDWDNSLGLGKGLERGEYIESPEGKLMDAGGVTARYVRLYSNGHHAGRLNHYVEVAVFGKPVNGDAGTQRR